MRRISRRMLLVSEVWILISPAIPGSVEMSEGNDELMCVGWLAVQAGCKEFPASRVPHSGTCALRAGFPFWKRC